VAASIVSSAVNVRFTEGVTLPGGTVVGPREMSRDAARSARRLAGTCMGGTTVSTRSVCTAICSRVRTTCGSPNDPWGCCVGVPGAKLAYGAAAQYETGGGPFSIAVGDLDGDDDLDLVVVNYYGDDVSVLRGMAMGRSGPPSTTRRDTTPSPLRRATSTATVIWTSPR